MNLGAVRACLADEGSERGDLPRAALISGCGDQTSLGERNTESDVSNRPWDIGDGTNIDALCREIELAGPGLNRAGVQQRLRARRPDLFKRRSEVLAMQAAPLPALAGAVAAVA